MYVSHFLSQQPLCVCVCMCVCVCVCVCVCLCVSEHILCVYLCLCRDIQYYQCYVTADRFLFPSVILNHFVCICGQITHQPSLCV